MRFLMMMVLLFGCAPTRPYTAEDELPPPRPLPEQDVRPAPERDIHQAEPMKQRELNRNLIPY